MIPARNDANGFDARTFLAAVLVHEGLCDSKTANEVVFHLTDWSDELRGYFDVVSGNVTDLAVAQRKLLAFITHAPAHLAAAHKLAMGAPVRDVFDIGAVESAKDDTAP